MKNAKLRFSALVLALVMCFGLFVSCGDKGITLEGVKKDPYAAIMAGYEKYADALEVKYGKVFEVFDKLAKGTGTYSASFSIPDEGDMSVNAVYDNANGAYSGKATLGVMGFNTDINLWGDKNNIAVKAPALFGDTTYGVKFDTLETDLANSELISSITGGMSFDDLKATLETEAGIKWDDLKGVLSVEKWKTAFDKYIADTEAFMKAKEYTVAEENVKIGETDVTAISVEYVTTKEDSDKMNGLAIDMVKSVCGDILTATGVNLDEAMAESVTEDITGDITSKCYLNKSTGAIVAADVDYGEMGTAKLVFGADASKAIDMSVSVNLTLDGETVEVSATAKEVTEQGKGGFDIDATVKFDGEEHTVALDIVRNDADGKYEIKVSADGEEMGTIAGTLTYSAEEIKLTVDSMTSEGETTEIGLALSAKAGGTVEALPEYTNILSASAEELAGIIGMLGSAETPDFGSGDEYFYVDDPDVSVGADDFYFEPNGDVTFEDICRDLELNEEDTELFKKLCNGMTVAEIQTELESLEQLNMTVYDLIDMMKP